uniref:Uncharacterized protein n=1 Tax=Arundo donax TaxID=35708 RepID=A0A0A9HJ73_ARUDO
MPSIRSAPDPLHHLKPSDQKSRLQKRGFPTCDGELNGQRSGRGPEAELVSGHAAPVVVHRAGVQRADLDVVDLAGGIEEVAVRGVLAGGRHGVVPGDLAVLHHGLDALVVGDP